MCMGPSCCAQHHQCLLCVLISGQPHSSPALRGTLGCRDMAVPRRGSGSLKYDPTLVPESGIEVLLSCAAPVKQADKDAAGHAFHSLARRQSGLDKGAAGSAAAVCRQETRLQSGLQQLLVRL